MKIATRAFVLALVITGFAATSQSNSAKIGIASVAPRASFMPVPSCAPGDPNACGMKQNGY